MRLKNSVIPVTEVSFLKSSRRIRFLSPIWLWKSCASSWSRCALSISCCPSPPLESSCIFLIVRLHSVMSSSRLISISPKSNLSMLSFSSVASRFW